MARRAHIMNAFTKGVFDPLLRERVDLTHYYNAMRTGRNIEILPQGGFRRRAGSWKITRVRRKLEPIPLTAGLLTAHNGGTTANLLDQGTATFVTSAVGTSPFVAVEIDLGGSKSVVAVDVSNFMCAANSYDQALAVEYYNGSAWVAVGNSDDASQPVRRDIRTSARTRRFAVAPQAAPIVAQNWRVVLYGASGCGTFTIGDLRFWAEKTSKSPVRQIEFSKSSAEIYQLVLTDRNIDVYQHGVWRSAIPIALDGSQVRQATFEQSLDTLFVFHPDLAFPQVQHQGKTYEWGTQAPTLTNLPSLSSSTAFSGAQNDVQQIAFPTIAAGNKMVLFLGDQLTTSITYVDAGTLPGQIVAVLQGLPGVATAAADLSAALVAASPVTVAVTFSGSNGNRAWPQLSAVLLGQAASPVTTNVQRGLNPSGKIMDATTGWPRCGVVHQSRLFLGGFRSAPETVMCSRTGSLFDFTITGTPKTADMGLLFTLDTDKVETILAMFVGLHLQIYTENSEWWTDSRTVDATAAFNMIRASNHGSEAAVPRVIVDNAVLFVQRGGGTLHSFTYDNISQNYLAEPLSLLGAHLLNSVAGMSFRQARTVNDGNLIYMVNGDGTAALLTLLKSQDVIALVSWDTQGTLLDVTTDANYDVWMLVDRGVDVHLELRDQSLFLDSAVTYTAGSLTHLADGTQVYALVNGDVSGPYTVASGSISLSIAGTAVVGLDYTVVGETLDLREKLQQEQPFRAPARIYRCDVSLISTGNVAIGANGQSAVSVPLRFFDGGPPSGDQSGDEPANDWLGVPMMSRLYTGDARIDGLDGFTRHGRVVVTQTAPAPLIVRSLRYEVSY